MAKTAKYLSQELISYIDGYAGDTDCLPIIYLAAETHRDAYVIRSNPGDMTYSVSDPMSLVGISPGLNSGFYMMAQVRQTVDDAFSTLNQTRARRGSQHIHIELDTFGKFMQEFVKHAKTRGMTVRELPDVADAYLICMSVPTDNKGVFQRALENESLQGRKTDYHY